MTHLAAERPRRIHNPVDGHDVPVPHFGLILPIPRFHELAQRLRDAGTEFVIEPHVRFGRVVHRRRLARQHRPR